MRALCDAHGWDRGNAWATSESCPVPPKNPSRLARSRGAAGKRDNFESTGCFTTCWALGASLAILALRAGVGEALAQHQGLSDVCVTVISALQAQFPLASFLWGLQAVLNTTHQRSSRRAEGRKLNTSATRVFQKRRAINCEMFTFIPTQSRSPLHKPLKQLHSTHSM